MSEISEKNASIELERCMKFWEMRDEILRFIEVAVELSDEQWWEHSRELHYKIKSISGKEGEE